MKEKIIRVADKDGVQQTLLPTDFVDWIYEMTFDHPDEGWTIVVNSKVTFKNVDGVLCPRGPMEVIGYNFKRKK